MKVVYVLIYFSFFLYSSIAQQNFFEKKDNHAPKELNNRQVRYLANLSDTKHMDELLDNILIPRVVGTPGHDKVRQYIIQQLEELGWDVKVDEFEDRTPNFGTLTFRNVIGSLNPLAERFLVLACHYDSKYFENEEFLGATDSAVPCAMMLNLIKVMNNDLEKIKNRTDLSLKLIFFDGEEAFKQWGPDDSLYGSRHLARKMDSTVFRTASSSVITDLHRIDVLILLDLIGPPKPQFYSFFSPTERWYVRLADAEDRLARLKLLKYPKRRSFNRKSSYSFIEDDHIPFLEKRVPIIHLIPIPFPKEWHTTADNRDIVDMPTVENINKVLRIFVTEYLHLLVNSQ